MDGEGRELGMFWPGEGGRCVGSRVVNEGVNGVDSASDIDTRSCKFWTMGDASRKVTRLPVECSRRWPPDFLRDCELAGGSAGLR